MRVVRSEVFVSGEWLRPLLDFIATNMKTPGYYLTMPDYGDDTLLLYRLLTLNDCQTADNEQLTADY